MRYYIAIAILAVFFSAGSHAEDWSLSTFAHGPRSQVAYEASSISKPQPRWRATAQRHRQRRARAHHRHHHEHVRLYRHNEKPMRGMHCLERVTVVGTQWATEAGAEENAQKAFMESVRWEFGEQFMEIANAEGYARRCSRSSIGEVAGQTFHRCQVSARPCRPALESAQK